MLKEMNIMLDKLRLLLAGKKSYIAAVGLICTALAEYINDSDLGKLVQRIFEALAVAGIRAGISKVV